MTKGVFELDLHTTLTLECLWSVEATVLQNEQNKAMSLLSPESKVIIG
jgi:hypothetical protein